MTKTKLLITAFVSILFFTKANAQVDTTRFDLGRMQLKKDFTQSVTVKGEDLQKMPFTNLAEAINVWFNGTYTKAINMVYVIDGNLVNDVNAYSIYDIDQVTLIQNAITQVSGASQQQQMVIITTKRHNNKGSGITVADQVNVSGVYTNNILGANNAYQTGLKSTTTIAHQVYVSAYKNTGNIEFGASADYLGDELPQIKETTSNTDYRLGRLRLNGYFDAKFGNSVLDVTAGYAPQTGKDNYSYNTQYINETLAEKANEHIFNTSVKLITHILPGLTNDLHADYDNYGLDENGTWNLIYTTGSNTPQNTIIKNGNANHTILAYDNLSYTAKIADWSLEPALNLSFRSLRDSSGNSSSTYGPDGQLEQSGGNYIAFKSHMLLLTPSVSLYYKNYFGVTGGLLYNIVNKSGFGGDIKKRVFPFISASLDVAQLINPTSALSIKVYGAYAMADPTVDNSNSLDDFNSSAIQIPVVGGPISQSQPLNGYSGFYYAEFNSSLLNTTKTFNSVTTGITVAPVKGGPTFSYFFNRYNYLTAAFIYEPPFLGVATNISFDLPVVSIQHRFAMDYIFSNNSLFNWHTGINATMIKQTYENVYAGMNINATNSNNANEWTGGWVNRFNYRSFFAGADLLYLLNQKEYSQSSSGVITTTKINSFSLQNLYAGYRFKVAGTKNLEVFANGRNLFQNKKETITDSRYYYGLGFKLSL